MASLMYLKALQQAGPSLSARVSQRTGGRYQMHMCAQRVRDPGEYRGAKVNNYVV